MTENIEAIEAPTTCDCGKPLYWDGREGSTLVGYYSPPGHNHDDNCITRFYACEDGHTIRLSRQNRCPVCDWRGRAACFCHQDGKVREWPIATIVKESGTLPPSGALDH